MTQCLLVELECLLIVLLCVLHLAQNEAEVTFQLLNFSPKFSVVRSVGSRFKLQHLLSSITELLALFEFTFEEEMVSEVLQSDWVSGV